MAAQPVPHPPPQAPTRDAALVALEPVQQLPALRIPDGRRAVAARRREAAPAAVEPHGGDCSAAVRALQAVL